ncbi:hypothetical protein [Bosea sp. (in: a-proteobacteria)]|uniref:hypothetical protein n=1 Tax=Bosea sp. (in: a-proteobacteria) TaxID=1871050 RepID=UPI004034F395
MNIESLIDRVRDHYVEQFSDFAVRQKEGAGRGAAEVKLQLGEASQLFGRMYCADFVKNDDESRVVEFWPEHVLEFQQINGSFGQTALTIDYLRWDDILFIHDVEALPADALANWFRHWFDPDEERYDAKAALSGIAHSMVVTAKQVSVDLGTAAPVAFWDMLQLIADAGATHVRISTSRIENDPDQ